MSPAFRHRCAAILLLLASTCGIAQARPPEGQARFRQSNAEYKARRERLRAVVDGPIVLYGYTGHEDATEVALFFQEQNFYYLTGHSEPGAALVLTPNSPATAGPEGVLHEILYLPQRDPKQEIWDGPKLGPGDLGVNAKTGFEIVEPITNLRSDLQKLAKMYETIYTLLPPEHEEGYPHFTESVAAIRAAVRQVQLKDISARLYAMRQVKSQDEIALIQKAIDVSIDAHLDAMRTMRPGLFEYQIAARMKEIHGWGGCAREAYAPIVGAGFNGTVLHYSALDSEIRNGDAVVIDVGGECGGYAADITRTVPANGKFTPRQREIYELVLGAQNAALAAVRPGATMIGTGKNSLQQIVLDYFNAHPETQGHVLTKYYPHSVSHHLGLDVHDPGDRARPLEPGMVITVEPGIYIPEENLGVRIEDDVLVTKDGYKLLTARLPRTADEIERIMKEGHADSSR